MVGKLFTKQANDGDNDTQSLQEVDMIDLAFDLY